MPLGMCSDLGHSLASVHNALNMAFPPVQQSFFNPSVRTKIVVEKIDYLVGLVKKRRARDSFDWFALEYLQEMKTRIYRCSDKDPGDFDLFTTQYIHGDFQPYNVLFHDKNMTAILDWERVSVQPVALEIIRTLALWFILPASGEIDIARVRSFMIGYSKVGKIDFTELVRMLPRFWWSKMHDVWVFEYHYCRHDFRADYIAIITARLVNWIEKNTSLLTSNLTSLTN